MTTSVSTTDVENALLKVTGYVEVGSARSGPTGVWTDPDGNRFGGGREQALEEAIATVVLAGKGNVADAIDALHDQRREIDAADEPSTDEARP